MSLRWLSILVAPTLLAIACGGEGSSPTPSPAVILPFPTPEPTATNPRTDTATPGPAVQRIAYIGGDGDVWVVNGDGSGKRKLFDADPGALSSFSWSPDGLKLAISTRDDIVHIAAANGDPPLQVAADQFLAWSPTSDMFAVGRFAEPPEENTVLVLDLRGNTVIELTGASRPSFSADGARLAFFRVAGQGFLSPDVRGMVADLDSGRVSPIDPDEEPSVEILSKGPPIFSPGSPSLLAYGDRLIDLDRSEEGSLPGSATRWSPDGRYLLVVCGGGRGGQVYDVEAAASILEFNVDPMGTDAPCSGIIDHRDLLTAWSTNSRLLSFYEVGPAPEFEPALLHIQEIVSGDDKTIAMRYPASFEFSPDSSRVLFSNPDGIWRVDADGSNVTLLAEGTAPAWQPQP